MLSKTINQLGTKILLKLPSEALFSYCFSELKRIEQKYSRFLEDSRLTKINNTKGFQEIDKETLYLIKKGLEYEKNTCGYFSLSVKNTLDRFGYDKDYTFKKRRQLLFPNTKKSITLKENKLKLSKPIDFGGLGKGYALDSISKILDKKEVETYFLSAGGDIKVKGEWKILLEHPDDNTKIIGYVILTNKAIASSSSNRRKWKEGHHLINPKKSKPSNSNIKSLFVISSKGIDADSYSTAFFVMGYEKAREIAKKVGVEVLIITTDDKIYQSKEFNATLY